MLLFANIANIAIFAIPLVFVYYHHVKHSKGLDNIAYLIGNLTGYVIEVLEILSTVVIAK